MFRADMLRSQAIGFFSGERQNTFRFSAERHFHGSRDALSNGDALFDFLADGFDGALVPQIAVSKAFIFAHETEQEVLSFDTRASILASLVTCEENYPTRFFCES